MSRPEVMSAMSSTRITSFAVFLTITIAFVFGLHGAGSAHNKDAWYPRIWTDRWIEYHLSTDNSWSSGWTSAIDSADKKWSNISTSDGFYFERLSDNQDWVSCLNVANEDSIVERISLAPNELGVTMKCPGSPLSRFLFSINKDYTWYFTSGNDSVAGTTSAIGLGAHEFGHATGFSGHWDDGTTSLCDSSDPAGYHTMCSATVSGADSAWRWESLETHDVHTFENAYP